MGNGEPSAGVSRRRFLIGGALVAAGLGGAAAVAVRLETRRRADAAPSGPAGPAGGSWSDLTSLGSVAPVHASLLPSGYILMGGVDHAAKHSFPNFIVDPSHPGPVSVEPMNVPMRSEEDSLFCAGHAYLADGRMLFVGGQHITPETGLDYGVLYDDRGGTRRWMPADASILGG
jgi:hypothetical protein